MIGFLKNLKLINKTSILEARVELLHRTIKQQDEIISKQKKLTKKQQDDIYNSIRNDKIKNNELLSFTGYEISLKEKEKGIKGFVNRLFSKLSGKNILSRYKLLYFGYGKQVKLIDIESFKDKVLSTEEKEAFLSVNSTDDQWVMDGKTLVFANKDTIITPNFSEKIKDFIYDISPVYLWSLLNMVFDTNLTQPKKDEGMFKLTPKKIFIGLIVLGIVYYLQTQKGG